MVKHVVFVCLGNICRSPLAEALFKDQVKLKGLEDHYFIIYLLKHQNSKLKTQPVTNDVIKRHVQCII